MTLCEDAMLEEFDHLMELSISDQDALARYQGPNALNDRIMEWFQTPEGTIADFPSWGNMLKIFQHEPPTVHLEVVMEARIISKLSNDCGVAIMGIRIDFLDIDLCRIQILYDGGMFDSGVNINALQ
jgi:hypothetical protein